MIKQGDMMHRCYDNIISLSNAYCDSMVSLGDAFENAGKAGANAGASLRASFEELLIAIEERKVLMQDEYKKHIGRLPGSTRTSRLRKKRDTMVSNWYIKFVNFDGNTGR